ncbi:YtpR family tRNA-binding protein [Bacillus chungangensis]|uniref:tRNA-binding protein n=1 Tax=Bacillus chungangensis TaxID=587633 RepID=A0ABT9WUK4_9BACI|nr:DUF4479 family protein [Bacillus chungangensis]MDQ0176866.1 tRNA-binding protein [Bacillus chungangensis]
MNVFYNQKGIGDVLIITLTTEAAQEKTFERKGDVVQILEKETNRVIGYNIFNFSRYMEISNNGLVDMNKEILEKINQVLLENGVTDQLTADFSPKFVVGFVKEVEKHPNADKLSVCKVDAGEEILQIVCGAPNVAAGQKVVVAKVGAVMPSGMVIKDATLRGIPSSGMICAARELALPNAPQEKGILVLEDEYVIGQAFTF